MDAIGEKISFNEAEIRKYVQAMQKEITKSEEANSELQEFLKNLEKERAGLSVEIEDLKLLIEKWELVEKYSQDEVRAMVPENNEAAMSMVLANFAIFGRLSLERQLELVEFCPDMKVKIGLIKVSDKSGEIMAKLHPEMTAQLIAGSDSYLDLDLLGLLHPKTFLEILERRDTEGKYVVILAACELESGKSAPLLKDLSLEMLLEVFSEGPVRKDFRQFLASIEISDLESGKIDWEEINDEELYVVLDYLFSSENENVWRAILELHKKLGEDMDWKEHRVEDLLELVPSGAHWFENLIKLKDPKEQKRRAEWIRRRRFSPQGSLRDENYPEGEIELARKTYGVPEVDCQDLVEKITDGMVEEDFVDDDDE